MVKRQGRRAWRTMGQGRTVEPFGQVRVWSLHLILKAMERLGRILIREHD